MKVKVVTFYIDGYVCIHGVFSKETSDEAIRQDVEEDFGDSYWDECGYEIHKEGVYNL